ncbi:MAG TPA: ABC transporter ATP-binding protein [Ilumatobacteraceae bacterium]|nr:ABC transporter ATP-binding protein [Ilumatobacteraceae bacterium]HRB05452.1 ABC transporter ATP-binding protein [Ilumatobacteraceae bacterium]
MLEVDAITTRYGAITALHEASLEVRAGEIVALVGPNGAGKTTLLNTVAGLLRPATGSVRFEGNDITGSEPASLVRSGLALVPEHRRIFKDLTVEENLRLGGSTASAADRHVRLDEAAELFPVLRSKWTTSAGFLSGGEAQQLAVARALMSNPRLLLLDEPTLGLAPTMVDVVFDLLERLRSQGRTLLVVEQNATRALALADRAYLLRTGRMIATGTGAELAADTSLFDSFIGGEA